jgi:hypothetical protein
LSRKPQAVRQVAPELVAQLGEPYASAVHARWIGPDERTRVAALAVASEPCIFWRGDGVEAIIDDIAVPAGAGRLVPASSGMNGPSGRSLDECFLRPLGYNNRDDAWLCDIVPHSCQNEKQLAAVERAYQPLMKQFGLPEVSLPPVPDPLCNDARRETILNEIQQSGADTVVLLGDEPIKCFLRFFDNRRSGLGDFGRDAKTYGKRNKVRIDGRMFDVIPLVHPRQASKLGTYSPFWHGLHQAWMADRPSHSSSA